MPVLFLLLAILTADAAPVANGTIAVRINGTAQPVTVSLQLRDGESWKDVGYRSLPSSVRAAQFDNLSAGVYEVLAAGTSGTEQFATKVVIGGGDKRTAAIAIDPILVTGRVRIGSSDVGPAVLFLQQKEFHWRGSVDVDPDGTFRFTLWQRGPYFYSVRAGSMTTSFTSTIDLSGVSPIAFPIDIPDGHITGTVRDAKSGKPVGGVSVTLQTDGARGSHHVSVTTDGNGRFDFSGLPFGRQTVRAISGAYLEPLPIVFDLGASNDRRELDIRLDAGRTISVSVTDAGNLPVSNANVFTVVDGRRRARATTNEKGSTNLALPEDGAATLFVIPNERSFGVMRLDHAGGSQVSLHLPPASSSLRIRARTTDDKAMPSFSLLMRYNGDLMPLEISDELTALQGVRLNTNEASEVYLQNIPAGRYEFWPFRTTEEAESILAAGNAVTPPIQVDVHPGENSVVVKFAAR